MSYHASVGAAQLGILPALPFLLPLLVVGGGTYVGYQAYTQAAERKRQQEAAEEAAKQWTLPEPEPGAAAVVEPPLPSPPPERRAAVSAGDWLVGGAVALGVLALTRSAS